MMYEIPDINDKVNAINKYLESNKDERESDTWIMIHDPNITAHLNGLSKSECHRLLKEMWSWKQEFIGMLADPISEVTNPYIDGNFIYGKIFLAIDDYNTEEYLIENIHIVTHIPKRTQSIEFYYKLRDKAIRVNDLVKKTRNEHNLNTMGDFGIQNILAKIKIEEAQ